MIKQKSRVSLANTLETDILAPNGETYRLLMHVPPTPAPVGGWPLLVMVDGNALFATARDAARIQASYTEGTDVGPGVIAAIGYPTDDAYDPLRRSWDLAPPPGRSYPPFKVGGPEVRTGGAVAFLDLLEHQVMPTIEALANIDPQRRTLFGHSFGGLFALLTLYRRPALFGTIISASPALYWEDEVLAPFEQAFRSAMPAEGLHHRVILSAGEWEGDTLPPFQRGRPDAAERQAHRTAIQTVAMAAALTARLNALDPSRLRATFEVHAGENHMSVLPVAINRAVQAAFKESRQDLDRL